MTSFADQFRDGAYGQHEDVFGELADYTPDGSATAVSITVMCVERQKLNEDEVGNEAELELIEVTAKRSAGEGIADPELGDTLLRSAAEDPQQRVYLFQGEISHVTAHNWTLLFGREKVTSAGGR